MTREELIETLLQEIVGPLSQVKGGFRQGKHILKTKVNKVKHNMAIRSGKAKAGSHWSQSSK